MTGTDIHIRRLNPSLIKALDEKAAKLKRNRNDLIIEIIENAVSHDLFTATEQKYQALSNQYMQAFEQAVENNTQVLKRNTEAYLQIKNCWTVFLKTMILKRRKKMQPDENRKVEMRLRVSERIQQAIAEFKKQYELSIRLWLKKCV